jgi:hypothetical protein
LHTQVIKALYIVPLCLANFIVTKALNDGPLLFNAQNDQTAVGPFLFFPHTG